VHRNTQRYAEFIRLVNKALNKSLAQTPMQFGFTTITLQPNQKTDTILDLTDYMGPVVVMMGGSEGSVGGTGV
jgi:hypothetical protein